MYWSENKTYCNGKQDSMLLNPITSTWVNLYTTVRTDHRNFTSGDLARTQFWKIEHSTAHLMDNGTTTQY